MITHVLIGLGISLAVLWGAVAGLVIVMREPRQSAGELARVVPDAVKLAAALYRDPTLPRSVRRRLRIALVYNLQPINLIPDVIPVIGFLDNAAVLIWALRSALRVSGPVTVRSHWKGSSGSLIALYRALRLTSADVAPGLQVDPS